MSFGEKDDELNCTLWVGNLDPQITEAALFDVFVQGGPIEKIHIPKGKDGSGHKGYCFITFQHNESVPYSMNVLDGTWLGGKLLKLQPRPGSKHKKLMDAAKECDQRQTVQPQQLHMSFPIPQQLQSQQQQWFLAPPHPQMAQFQNMLVYPNQMLQAYSSCLPNLNNGMTPTLIQLPSGMPQLIPLPMQTQAAGIGTPVQQQLPQEHQQQQYPAYQARGVRPAVDFRHPRPARGISNGYSMQRHSNGVSNAQQLPSQYSQSQVLNGSQSQSLRFSHANTRGPRPQVNQRPQFQNQSIAPRISNSDNGNAVRPQFSHRSQAQGPTFQAQQQQPLVYTTPVFRHQSPTAAGGTSLQYQGQPLAQVLDRQFYQGQPVLSPTGDVYTY